MKTVFRAFIDLAAHLEFAKFEDPDEGQGAKEVVSWCLSEASDEERALLGQVLSERVAELRANGAPPAVLDFYEKLVSRLNNVASYEGSEGKL